MRPNSFRGQRLLPYARLFKALSKSLRGGDPIFRDLMKPWETPGDLDEQSVKYRIARDEDDE
jgi:hypothetical protein